MQVISFVYLILPFMFREQINQAAVRSDPVPQGHPLPCPHRTWPLPSTPKHISHLAPVGLISCDSIHRATEDEGEGALGSLGRIGLLMSGLSGEETSACNWSHLRCFR